MDSSEQRRKRKRFTRPPCYLPSHHFFSVRSLITCFAFITFLYILSYRVPITPSSFRPVLVISSSLSLLSSSSSSSTIDSIRRYSNTNFLSPLKIDDRILFPDHVLLLLSRWNNEELECVYYRNDDSGSDEIVSVKRDVLSVEEYGEFRLIVRCPLPPLNYSAVVNLKRRGGIVRNLVYEDNQIPSWENLAYEAALDGDVVVVFAKGLNLKPDRESDPTQFSCHFSDGHITKAITAAQEVVRCLVPRKITENPDETRGIRVTIGVTHSKSPEPVLLPSVAKIFSKIQELNQNHIKHDVCVCTMVWNQASSLREWILYHSWLGVERWFIYDNNSDDNIQEVIEELKMEEYNVTRHSWPWIKTQEAGFSHCALTARDQCNWISFMDVDEFFYFPIPNRRRQRFKKLGFPGQNSLKTLAAKLSTSTSIGEIRTACHSFGPSGLSSPPSQGVTAGYTCRVQSPERHKSIVRPEAIDATLLNVVHHFHLKKGLKYLNLPGSVAVINHYKYQVWEAFRAKFFRRVATYVVDWQENQNEGSRDRAPGLGTAAIEPPDWRLQFCEVWDTGLRDIVLANLADPATGLLPWERSPLTL